MKGFTLIELLAVIVILAIILIIAMPVINNVITGVKKSAFESSVKNIIKSGEYTYASNMFKPNRELVYTFENSEITGNYPEAKLEFSGEVPKSGNLIVREDGKIAASLFNGEYCATKDYDTNNVTILDIGIDDCYSEIALPSVTLNGNSILNVEINTPYTEQGTVAKTIGGEDITTVETKIFKNEVEVPSVDTTSIGTYRIVYTVYEKSKMNYIEREVNIVDTITPEITIPASTSIVISEVDTFNFLTGVSVTDNSLEALTVSVSGNISKMAGSYEITYSSTDSSGNMEEVVRIINVNDIEAPVITLIGASTLTLNVGDIYTEQNATSTDDADGNLTISIVKTGSVNTAIAGTYYITYTSTDSSNNESSKTRTIIVNPVYNLVYYTSGFYISYDTAVTTLPQHSMFGLGQGYGSGEINLYTQLKRNSGTNYSMRNVYDFYTIPRVDTFSETSFNLPDGKYIMKAVAYNYVSQANTQFLYINTTSINQNSTWWSVFGSYLFEPGGGYIHFTPFTIYTYTNRQPVLSNFTLNYNTENLNYTIASTDPDSNPLTYQVAVEKVVGVSTVGVKSWETVSSGGSVSTSGWANGTYRFRFTVRDAYELIHYYKDIIISR